MAKIGTAHVEIKPVLNEEALAEVCKRIEEAVAAAVDRGLARPLDARTTGPFVTYGNPASGTR